MSELLILDASADPVLALEDGGGVLIPEEAAGQVLVAADGDVLLVEPDVGGVLVEETPEAFLLAAGAQGPGSTVPLFIQSNLPAFEGLALLLRTGQHADPDVIEPWINVGD